MPRFHLSASVLLPALLFGVCAPAGSGEEELLTLEVAPHTVPCQGEAPQRCLQVRREPAGDWTYFYDRIQGFVHEEGYRYRIQVARQQRPDPPADASSTQYRLLRVLSKERPE